MSRLLANLPLLKAGLPPLIIAQEKRREYIQVLAEYQLSVGQLNTETGVWPDEKLLAEFEVFCLEMYQSTQSLLMTAVNLQKDRS